MNPWIFGSVIAIALLVGSIAGWLAGKKLGLAMPNVIVSALVLVAGSLGGPLLTAKLIGHGLWAASLALVIAGWAAGLVFWSMGERQGAQRWL